MTTKRLIQVALLACAGQFFSMAAQSANILFVSDSQTDTNIPGVLTAAGHTVTTVLDDFTTPDTNSVLTGSLAAYDVIVWSATGDGSGDVHAVATAANLSSWVTSGGRLFVTGYDSIASPDDPVLQGLLGGTDANDSTSNPASGPVANIANSLTTGVVDIRGVTPTGAYSDQDSLFGLGGGTVCMVVDQANPSACLWTLRTLGSGEIAYVSNGQSGPASAWASWTDTSAGGAGAYNAALRNFAFASGAGPIPAPTSIPTLSEWGIILLSSLLALGTILTLRRQRQ